MMKLIRKSVFYVIGKLYDYFDDKSKKYDELYDVEKYKYDEFENVYGEKNRGEVTKNLLNYFFSEDNLSDEEVKKINNFLAYDYKKEGKNLFKKLGKYHVKDYEFENKKLVFYHYMFQLSKNNNELKILENENNKKRKIYYKSKIKFLKLVYKNKINEFKLNDLSFIVENNKIEYDNSYDKLINNIISSRRSK